MAEELRELRLSKQIPAKDMVAVVQQIYPKYDKTVQSKCENGEIYGVSLRPDAMAALYAHFAPEVVEQRQVMFFAIFLYEITERHKNVPLNLFNTLYSQRSPVSMRL